MSNASWDNKLCIRPLFKLVPRHFSMLSTIVCGLALILSAGIAAAQPPSEIDRLIERGEFAAAEQMLRQEIVDLQAPVVDAPAIQLEILRRTRLDFPLTEGQLLSELRESIDDVAPEDIRRWRAAGDLLHRVIDGQIRYFRRAGSNLFLANEEARQRRNGAKLAKDQARAAQKFNLTQHLAELVELSESTTSAELSPVFHRVKYAVKVQEGHPRLQNGAVVRAWLPFPQEYRQQRDVRLVSAEPEPQHVAPNGAPHRSVYFEQTIADAGRPATFQVEFTFVTSAFCPQLDPEKVAPYDIRSDLYREYTRERPPHIVLTPHIRQLVAEIVGAEQNPLLMAQRLFRWVSKNVPWCGEMEYSIIPSLSQKGLAARRGDCGVQGMVFITLCRAAGVPARWQSGWETKPNDWNMHDWSEIYVEPWGWLPVDASYGVRQHDDPRVRDFYCGHMDPYRMIVNLDYARPLDPAKTSFRSEPNDFQRGEVEIDGHNLYFGEWSWDFEVRSRRFEP